MADSDSQKYGRAAPSADCRAGCIFGVPSVLPFIPLRVAASSPEQQQTHIADYYDEFAARQRRTGLNARLWALYERLRTAGLGPTSRVLELGCGIGALTYLLARATPHGTVEAVDLSPESVRFATAQLAGQPNVVVRVHDVVTYQPTGCDFDFITLFDVIEHIPLELHGALFRHVATLMSPHTRLLIHIPHPRLIEHLRRHDPASLQVVDQSVELAPLVGHLAAAGLVLHSLDTYSLWQQDDYQFLDIRLPAAFSNQPCAAGLLSRAVARARHMWRGWMVRYPS